MQCAVCLAVLVLVLCLVRRAAPHVRRTLTPAIVRAVRRDLGLNRWMQGLRCEPLTAAVNASASFVSHPFYIICLPGAGPVARVCCGLCAGSLTEARAIALCSPHRNDSQRPYHRAMNHLFATRATAAHPGTAT